MYKQDKQTKTYRLQYGGYHEERGKQKRLKGVKYMVIDGDLTLGEKHTMQYTNDVL